MFGPSCHACADVARDEVNGAGGVLGRPLQLVHVDGGEHPARVAAAVGDLVDAGRVDAVVGWHISAVRKRLAPRIAHRVPYVYTTLYEGGETTPGVLVTGETPANQLGPALDWMARELGVVRWFVVGNDYVWPRTSAAVARRIASRCGAVICGDAYVPLGCTDFSREVRLVERSDAQGVLLLLVGQDAVHFNRAFTRAGLDAETVRLSTLMDENMLLASEAHCTRDLYTASAYFENLTTGSSLDFVGRYASRLGLDAPVPTSFGESCYEGLMLLAQLVGSAGSLDRAELLRVADDATYEGPRGVVRLRDSHAVQRVYLARADGLDFDVLDALAPLRAS